MNVGGNIEEPAKCPESSCGQTWTMQLMHNYSEYNDKQLIKMQVCTAGCVPTVNHAHGVLYMLLDGNIASSALYHG